MLKVMLTIVWNPAGFDLVNILPKRFKFNASYDRTQILDHLSKWRKTQVGATNRKLFVHADNARPHMGKMISWFMEQNLMERTLRPAYSPNLAPSDFYLFSYVTQLLSQCQFADQDSLLPAVSDILVGIGKVTLKSVFHNWMERLFQCSATGGEFVESRNFLH
jgi:histone-lysine N-methyltransferase SETMAR